MQSPPPSGPGLKHNSCYYPRGFEHEHGHARPAATLRLDCARDVPAYGCDKDRRLFHFDPVLEPLAAVVLAPQRRARLSSSNH